MDQATPTNQTFFGTSANSVKTQIWIAVSVYVLIAIIKKRLGLKQNLYTILQILSLHCSRKTPFSLCLKTLMIRKYTQL